VRCPRCEPPRCDDANDASCHAFPSWHAQLLSRSVRPVILVIRFIGVMNAAIWLGAAVFLTTAAAPAFFSGEVKTLGLHPFWTGAMAQLVLARFFYLQYICSAIAVAHLLAEWVYLGRPLQRLTLGLLLGLMLLGLLGGLWIQPKLKQLNLVRYGMTASYKPANFPPEERAAASSSFRTWHLVSLVMNFVALAGLGIYFWRVTHPTDNLRFVSTATKFRS